MTIDRRADERRPRIFEAHVGRVRRNVVRRSAPGLAGRSREDARGQRRADRAREETRRDAADRDRASLRWPTTGVRFTFEGNTGVHVIGHEGVCVDRAAFAEGELAQVLQVADVVDVSEEAGLPVVRCAGRRRAGRGGVCGALRNRMGHDSQAGQASNRRWPMVTSEKSTLPRFCYRGQRQ